MKYFDSHAHYYDERFKTETEEGADNLIGALLSDSVSAIINVGTSPVTSRAAVEQAKEHENMYTAIGIHPYDANFILNDMGSALSEIEELIKNPESKCRALGEIGLDYHYEGYDENLQKEYFEAQMSLAERLGIPVVIHDRDAHGDVMEIIRKYPRVKGIMHSYSGSVEMAEELVRLGYYISFSGTLTFKNARKTPEAAVAVPRERVLIETDAPYLAPHPHRGKINHSGYLEHTNARLAEIWGISPEECAKITDENARRFFGIK